MSSLTSFLPTVNLPLPVLIHSAGLSLLGLYTTFSSSSSPPSKKAKTPEKSSTHVADASSSPMLGISTFAIGLCYIFSSYMPIEQNQFLYASVPVRVLLGCVMGFRVVLDSLSGPGKPKLSQKDRNALIGVGLYDGIGGLILGWSLGNWSGKLPGW